MELLADEALMAAAVPIVVYWLYSGMYMALGSSIDRYRLNPPAHEDAKNMVSKRHVVRVVLTYQLLQLAGVAIATKLGWVKGGTADATATWPTTARQFAVAVVVYDGWQYAWHRCMHRSRFLYRHLHSWHHRLVVPYAYGALYNHPAEGAVAHVAGGLATFLVSGMSTRSSILFFTLCTMKGIDNHCGVYTRFHASFWNNAAYHDVHHQLRGTKHNFSQLFFVTWDKVFGTYMPYVFEEMTWRGNAPGQTGRWCPRGQDFAKKSNRLVIYVCVCFYLIMVFICIIAIILYACKVWKNWRRT